LACRSDGHFMQISFVNGIATQKGGTHVNYIVDQIIDKIINCMPKKNAVTIKPFQIKAHLNVYINCLIENPSFDSQTK
jgi:DNA topoisomerase-2